jgi:hypothetical protein
MDSGTSIGEIRELTDKEKVRGVYPESRCYVAHGEYLIVISKQLDQKIILTTLSPHCQTEERAWDCAWRLICTQMMATLTQ